MRPLPARAQHGNGGERDGQFYDSDFGAALKEPSPERFGRGYAGYWEVRNLRMAANIRADGVRSGSFSASIWAYSAPL